MLNTRYTISAGATNMAKYLPNEPGTYFFWVLVGISDLPFFEKKSLKPSIESLRPWLRIGLLAQQLSNGNIDIGECCGEVFLAKQVLLHLGAVILVGTGSRTHSFQGQ